MQDKKENSFCCTCGHKLQYLDRLFLVCPASDLFGALLWLYFHLWSLVQTFGRDPTLVVQGLVRTRLRHQVV